MISRKLLLPLAGALITAVVFGTAAFVIAQQAGVINGCVDPTGMFSVIGNGSKKKKCFSFETPISWNLQGVKGDKGDPGAPGPAGTSLHLYDANGQDLGIFINAPGPKRCSASPFDCGVGFYPPGVYTTFLPTPAVFAEFDINEPTGAATSTLPASFPVVYLQPGCAGPPYTYHGLGVPQETTYVPASGYRTSMFKITTASEVVNATIRSQLAYFGCSNSLPVQLPSVSTVIPLEQIPLPFTLPLAWPLTIK